MVWSTGQVKGRNRDYVVILHKLKDTEGVIQGVKFRKGYGVVDKTSKTYSQIKKLPMLKGALEFPLSHLKSLPFVISDRQVEVIYGKDVYLQYIKAVKQVQVEQEIVAKQQQEEVHLAEGELCKHRKKSGELCKNILTHDSKATFCYLHILEDPKLEEMGIVVPKILSKDEKKKWTAKIIKRFER